MEIKLDKISKEYGVKKAIDSLSTVIPDKSFTVILGPSGSGKTTLLRVIAGLLYPTSGRIYFDQEDVTDLPANKRNVALVFQNYTLFPHMTVEENLRFPLESAKTGKIFKRNFFSPEEISEKVEKTLNLLHIEEHRNKYPSQLSGGEQQRAAIGREVIREPVVFMFDEPLSNIDARLRYEMRTWIRKLHDILERSFIYVTHDQSEAMALGNLIILLQEGKIEQIGTPEELYDNPSNKFVAQFIGNYPMNFLTFDYDKKKLYINGSEIQNIPEKLIKSIKKNKLTKGSIGFRAEYIREYDKRKTLDERMLLLDCQIEDTEKVLDQQIISLSFKQHQLFYVTKTKKQLKKEEKIAVLVHSDHIYLFDNEDKRVR
ncbi:MAG: ABC transporter ATP-binding protein [Candidatus Heimdallarchaeaceae archaeon]|jgi:ABC-type sugar transport system ATPase subunit